MRGLRPFTAEASASTALSASSTVKKVVAVGWELQNSSPTACLWRWYQKN